MTDLLFKYQVAEDIGRYFVGIKMRRRNNCAGSLQDLLSGLLLQELVSQVEIFLGSALLAFVKPQSSTDARAT